MGAPDQPNPPSPRIAQARLHREAALRRQDLHGRRTAGDHEGAKGLLRSLAAHGFGEDGYPLDYTGPKTLT